MVKLKQIRRRRQDMPDQRRPDAKSVGRDGILILAKPISAAAIARSFGRFPGWFYVFAEPFCNGAESFCDGAESFCDGAEPFCDSAKSFCDSAKSFCDGAKPFCDGAESFCTCPKEAQKAPKRL